MDGGRTDGGPRGLGPEREGRIDGGRVSDPAEPDEPVDAWAVAGKVMLTVAPFLLIAAFFALHRWMS